MESPSTPYNIYYNLSNSYWPDLSTINVLGSSKMIFDAPYHPIVSNSLQFNLSDFDNPNNSLIEDATIVLQGKEEQIFNTFLTAYWNFHFSTTSLDWRVFGNLSYFKLLNNLYTPSFNFYYDYDFRNWQNFDLFEDFFWEHALNLYSWDEYIGLNNNFYEGYFFDKYYQFFFEKDKEDFIYKNQPSYGKFFATWVPELEYANNIYFDELLADSRSTPSFNLARVVNSVEYLNFDETFDSKFNFIRNVNWSQKNLIPTTSAYFNLLTYSTVFNTFRSDFEDTQWFKNFSQIFLPELFLPNFADDNTILNDKLIWHENLFDNFSLYPRVDGHFVLRSSIKNALVTYNAMQKVFKSRFDELRSHAKLTDYSNSFTNQLYISSPKTKYESLLGKNKISYYNINFYKLMKPSNFNLSGLTENYLNFYFFDFPFLMALKSDASRYLWFDWFAKWSYIEVQPASSSRYAIHGMPYFNKFFDYTGGQNEILNETESYLTRISKARKNYLANWTYTPFFLLKNNYWCEKNSFNSLLNELSNPLILTQFGFDAAEFYWRDLINSNSIKSFHPSFSNLNTYSKSSWKNNSKVASYYYNLSMLIDTLTRREYLFRQLFLNNNKIVFLPTFLTNSLNNNLISDVKTAFAFVDPIDYANENTKNIQLSSLQHFNFSSLKSLLSESNFTSIPLLVDSIFLHFINYERYNAHSNNELLYKNQYRPLRKGLNNMIRLQASGAIAMPTEIRMQILASSRDVIHSWAVPSAGVKIDCVPGYTSHKVIIFLVSGIFWGQCMEVCGRYHHWMPIVVYFMKRDLFFLWCTHFVFLSGANSMWTINDRSFVDYIRVVNYDKDGWIEEIL